MNETPEPIRAALAELVRLKDLRDWRASDDAYAKHNFNKWQAAGEEYGKCQPLAWEAARAALAATKADQNE